MVATLPPRIGQFNAGLTTSALLRMLITRIDRYLLTLYARILSICFCSVAGLLIVIHLFNNLEDFDRYAEASQATLPQTLVDYYGPFALSVFERLSAMLVLLAVLFTIGWLNKTNELTALLAAGIPKRRIIRPLLAASLTVILATAVLRETAIPYFQDQLDRKPSDLTGEVLRPIRPAFDPHSVTLIQGRNLRLVNKEIIDVNIKIQGGPLLPSVGNKILARQAVYREACPEHPAGYLLTDVQTPRNIEARPSIADPVSGGPLLLTPRDYAWLAPGSCFLASTIEYETLRGGSSWQQYASIAELVAHLRAERSAHSGNDLRVGIHQRLLRPLVDWTVLLLGIPILLMRPDRHMFWVAGVSLAVVGGFTAVVMGLAAIGSSGYLLSPQLAIWLPLIIFLPWGWVRTQQALNC